MKTLIENAPKIISEAAKSPLGISALLILAVSVLAWLFFGGSSEIFKIPIFLAVLLSFIVVVHYAHAYASRQNENTEDAIVVVDEEPIKPTNVSWSDPAEKGSHYSLTVIEAEILEALRGKPDIRWTKDLIVSVSRRGVSNFSKEEILKGIDDLEQKNYIVSNNKGIYHALDLAVLYYRSTSATHVYEIDEADYWDGT